MSGEASFRADTGVEATGKGSWSARIAEGWDIGGNANGGYLLALAVRAVLDATGRPDPVTVTAHYLAPGKVGPVTATVDVVREGRRFATAVASLDGPDRRLLQVLATTGDLSVVDPGAVERIEAGPPDLPAPEDCQARRSIVPSIGGAPSGFGSRVELLLHPDDAGFMAGEPSGEMRVRGWFRLRDGEPADTVALLLALDAFPPTAFNGRLPVAWVPTVELTAHVRARPEPGWLRCAFTTRFVSGGFLEEDGEVWDASGRLVAQSRQLALAPRAGA